MACFAAAYAMQPEATCHTHLALLTLPLTFTVLALGLLPAIALIEACKASLTRLCVAVAFPFYSNPLLTSHYLSGILLLR